MPHAMNPARDEHALVWVWRHPQPQGVAGRCIGRTDVPVDPRRTKRLARRIQAAARCAGLARVVYTSPLQRCAHVGRWLKAWGWTHVVDAALLELDFGTWDGQPWQRIGQAEVDAWCAAFATRAPGGGEPLLQLLQRAAAWQPTGCLGTRVSDLPGDPGASGRSPPEATPGASQPALVVGHAGWMLARRWAQTHGPGVLPTAADWPKPPGHGHCWHV